MNQDELLQTGEVAKVLDLSDARIRQLANQGQLRARKTRRGVRFFCSAEVEALRIERERAISAA